MKAAISTSIGGALVGVVVGTALLGPPNMVTGAFLGYGGALSPWSSAKESKG